MQEVLINILDDEEVVTKEIAKKICDEASMRIEKFLNITGENKEKKDSVETIVVEYNVTKTLAEKAYNGWRKKYMQK